jgi:hypothetical protein
MARTKKQSTDAAVREIRRKTRRKLLPDQSVASRGWVIESARFPRSAPETLVAEVGWAADLTIQGES